MNRSIDSGIDQSDDANDVHPHRHDPTYYYPDGNIVFLVEGLLFKIHASLVLPVDSILLASGNGGQRYPLRVNNLPERLTDTSDTNPIILQDVTVSQFRNYLLASLGRPHNPEYSALFTDPSIRERRNRNLLVRFLDIVHVSHQFGMGELKEWAASQLELVLGSMYDLAELSWDKDTLMRLSTCTRLCRRPKLNSLVANFVQYFISIWTAPVDRPTGQEHASSNLDTCVQLFKDSDLLNNNAAEFGCAFASVLSLGHQSAAWTSGVSRSQRIELYFAEVQLTNLAQRLRSIMWLTDHQPYQLTMWTCAGGRCRSEFMSSWRVAFTNTREDLRSDIPLRGVISLARLPQYRRLFSDARNPEPTPHTAPSLPTNVASYNTSRCLALNLPGDARPRDRMRCIEPAWPMDYLDYHIQLVYQELAQRYRDIVSDAGATSYECTLPRN